MEYVDPVVHYDFPHLTKAQMLADMKTILEAAGWTTSSTPSATVDGTFTSNPASTQIATINGQVYTAKTTPVNPTDFLIGSTAADTATNFTSCINSNSTTVTASKPSSLVVRLTAVTAGPAGNSIAVSEGLSGFIWASTTLSGGGYILQSGTTDDGLAYRVKVFDAATGNTSITVEAWSLDGTLYSNFPLLTGAAGQRLRCIADPYDFHTYKPGHWAQDTGYIVEMGMLKMVGNSAAVVVSGATAESPVAITTATPHGRTTGDQVFVHNIVVVADGLYTFTKTGDSAGTLDGTTGSGSYTSGGLLASNVTSKEQTGQLFWGCGRGSDTWGSGFRANLRNNPGNTGSGFGCRNQLLLEYGGGNAGGPHIVPMTYNRAFRNGRFIAHDAFLGFNEISASAEFWVQGLMFNAMAANAATPADELFQTPDGEWWSPFTHNGDDGTLFLRVPASITTL